MREKRTALVVLFKNVVYEFVMSLVPAIRLTEILFSSVITIIAKEYWAFFILSVDKSIVRVCLGRAYIFDTLDSTRKVRSMDKFKKKSVGLFQRLETNYVSSVRANPPLFLLPYIDH